MTRMRGIPTGEMMEQRFVVAMTEPSFDSMDPRISQGRKVWCFLEFLMAMVRLVIGLLAMHETCCPPSSPRLSKSSGGHHISKMGFLKLLFNQTTMKEINEIHWFQDGKLLLKKLIRILIETSALIHLLIVSDADYPGLAMSRSFGDFCLKDYGLIPTPEVATNSQIWDVLTNKQVINIVASAKNRSMAAKLVVKLAAREWKRKFIGLTIDDCTVICLFFKNPPLLSKSMTNVGRRSMRSHPELAVSRSCRSMGIDRKIGEEEGESVNRESKEDRKGVKGLNRVNSMMGISRTTRSLSHNQKAPKFFYEIEARESGTAMAKGKKKKN